jgi:hypothetical protein
MSRLLDALFGGDSPQRAASLTTAATFAAAAAVPLVLYRYYYSPGAKPTARLYPPGPPGLPLLGNLLQLPAPGGDRTLDHQLLDWYAIGAGGRRCKGPSNC